MFTQEQMFSIVMAGLLATTIWGLKIIFGDIRNSIKENKVKLVEVDKKFEVVDKRLDNHNVTINKIITAHNGAKCEKIVLVDTVQNQK